jgi:tetratricopeptide (TPR) repeat protein
VLEGSVRRGGGRARITARLIDVSDQTQLWADTFERDLQDTLQTEREVALRVASSLAMSVLVENAPARMPHPEAYDHYLRGRYLRVQATEASLRRAIEHFQQAIQIDADYADAHAGLADALLTLGAPGWEIDPPGPTLQRALESANRAITLAPRNADALAARALIRLNLEGDRAGAEHDIHEALAVNPSLSRAHQYYSTILTTERRLADAVDEASAARALDPLNPATGTTLGIRLYYAGRYGDAITEFQRVIDVVPTFSPAYLGMGQALREQGRLEESIAAMQQASAHGDGSTYLEARLGHAYAVAGRTAEARAILDRLTTEARTRFVSPFHFALVYAGLGEGNEVVTWLERCRDERSGWLTWIGVEREFAAYARLPAIAALSR